VCDASQQATLQVMFQHFVVLLSSILATSPTHDNICFSDLTVLGEL